MDHGGYARIGRGALKLAAEWFSGEKATKKKRYRFSAKHSDVHRPCRGLLGVGINAPRFDCHSYIQLRPFLGSAVDTLYRRGYTGLMKL